MRENCQPSIPRTLQFNTYLPSHYRTLTSCHDGSLDPSPPHLLPSIFNSIHYTWTMNAEPDDFALLVQFGRCLKINQSSWYLRASDKNKTNIKSISEKVVEIYLYPLAWNSPFAFCWSSISSCSVRMRYQVDIETDDNCCCSVTKLCPTLCDLDCGTSGISVLRYLLEFAQIRVHWVGDAI